LGQLELTEQQVQPVQQVQVQQEQLVSRVRQVQLV
jgi:hypothetical protein